jgi:hypothetical protein
MDRGGAVPEEVDVLVVDVVEVVEPPVLEVEVVFGAGFPYKEYAATPPTTRSTTITTEIIALLTALLETIGGRRNIRQTARTRFKRIRDAYA